MRTILSSVAVVAVLLPLATAAQTLEEVRHDADLRACAQIADERQRNECVNRVQAQIRAERIQRIEEQSRRRQAN